MLKPIKCFEKCPHYQLARSFDHSIQEIYKFSQKNRKTYSISQISKHWEIFRRSCGKFSFGIIRFHRSCRVFIREWSLLQLDITKLRQRDIGIRAKCNRLLVRVHASSVMCMIQPRTRIIYCTYHWYHKNINRTANNIHIDLLLGRPVS